MFEYFEALRDFPFLQHALAAGLLAAIACGVVGSYVVVRRISYMAGAIAHAVLAGLGAAGYTNAALGWSWPTLLHGAVIAALLAAIIIGIVSLRAKQREDTLIGAIWAVGMAIGVLFIYATPGYQTDLMSYLFGSLSFVGRDDLYLLACLNLCIVVTVTLFYHRFQAVCFDEEFARLRGVWVEPLYVLLLCLVALTVVLLVYVVGIILVIALLTLPAAIASLGCRTLLQMFVAATLLAALFTTAGQALAYPLDIQSGGSIILVTGGSYLLAMLGAAVWRAVSRRRSHAVP